MSSIFASDNSFYTCQYDWPDECFTQSGRSGVVLCRDGSSYRTPFFEAVSDGKFFRGEGDSVEDAETDCWQQYQERCVNVYKENI